jgi:hypothetical protein
MWRRFILDACGLTLAVALAAGAADHVIISEFLASNSNGLADENGDRPDWIELHNAGTNTVNLDGWFLTDSAANLTKWRLPATNLPPAGFLIIFASGKNRAVPGAPLHTSFQLSAGGEYLALVQPDGVTVASEFAPEFPAQLTDVSYGLAQNLITTLLVSNTSPVRFFIATNDIGQSWMTNSFNDASWFVGTNGVGYQSYVSGFAVRNIRANVGVCDLATAESVLADPARQAAVFSVTAPTLNYLNTEGGANFGGDVTFPGFTINVDENNFVLEATGIITIPTAGNWTFGVNSDDGFSVTLGANSLSYPPPRSPADTFATFNLAAGDYPVRLVFYECGGGSEVEFFAAAGTYSSFGTAFRLVGDTAGGGLAVKSLPGSGGGGVNLRPLIATDVQTQMVKRARCAYIRLPFVLNDASAYSSLRLRMKYDDGFVAYLNGVDVARRNAPALPIWSSGASSNRSDNLALVFEDMDLPGGPGLLFNGTNLLALHGLNETSTSSEFLQLAELGEYRVVGTTNHYFAVPSPGVANGAEWFAFVDNLEFTPGRGWFSNAVSVTITSATPGVSIRYTVNGVAPGPTYGLIYTGPIVITNTTVLRAVGYRDGFEPTVPETHTYIFPGQVIRQTGAGFPTNWGDTAASYAMAPTIVDDPQWSATLASDLLSIPTLSVAMDPDQLFGSGGIYVNNTGEGIAWERPCSLEYIRPDGKKGFHINCGIRLRGGVSRTMIPKHGFRVLFKNIYGPGKLDYDLYPDSPVKEFDTLVLYGMFNDHWLWGGAAAQMQRDQWCRDAQNDLGGYGPHGSYVHLYLDGLYWGLYNVGEKGDASYAAHYLGGEKEEYDAYNADELIDGDASAWNTMFTIANAGITNDTAYTNLSRYLNIPNFIDYLLMNFYAANTDWPWHNWNAARHRVPGAGFHFFSWDAEWTLFIGSDVNTDRTPESGGSPGVLYAALRQHPEFNRQFGDHAQRHLFNDAALTPARCDARWMRRANEIDRAIALESARWFNGYTRNTWLGEQSYIRSTWFPQRTAILLNQLRAAGLYPQLNAPVFAPFGGLVLPGYSLVFSNPNPSGVIRFTTDGSDPRRWGGAVSATAQTYTTPLVINSHTPVCARVHDGTNWSALAEATFYVVQDFSGLVLTEIMYHPPAFPPWSGDDLEFLELNNSGTNTLDLSGVRFTDGIDFAFTSGTRLAPGAFFVLVRNPAAFAARYPGVAIGGVFSNRLDNGGEKLALAHALGTNVLSVTYDNAVPWPLTPDGLGFSLVRANLSGNPNAPTSWRASAALGGSPGADDPAPNLPLVVINEVLTHTDLPDVDAIELQNLSIAPADVGGWFLSDDAAVPMKFRIPSGTTIPPGSFVVFTETNFNPMPGVPPSFSLGSLGESLHLFSGDATTNLTGYSHSIEFGAAANGVTFGRHVISTGEEQWPAQLTPTLGAMNSGPRVGPVVINEIMYHPLPGHDEFIELYNLSPVLVPLWDAASPTNAWRLNGLAYSFSNTVSIPAGGSLLLVGTDPVAFRTKYNVPFGVQVLGPFAGNLQDSGERLRLERPDTPGTNGVPYIVVDEVRYNDKPPWPVSADGEGPSLQRLAPGLYGNEPMNWFASGITPGVTNSFNQAPSVMLVSPTNGALFQVPADVALAALASDPDGAVTQVEFFAGQISLGVATNAPYQMTWTSAPVGAHALVAKARDNRLAVTVSAPVIITVEPPPLGNGIGLRGDYYDNIDLTGTRVRRIDPTVNFGWGSGQPDAGIGPDTFSVRWTGSVQPRFSETYTFYTVSDDGARLWVNNRLLIDNWTDHSDTEDAGFIELQGGVLYDIHMEMYENGGGATARLLWSSPSTAKEVIPGTQLYPPTSSNLPPVISLTSPTGGVFVAGSTLNLAADALDPDGAVFKVEFFNGPSKLGEGGLAPYVFPWTNVPAGQHTLRAVATDDSALSCTSAPAYITVVAGFTSNVTLVATGSVWCYRDTGEDLGSAWTTMEFNDAGWSTGPAQLGYGEGDERTVVSYGPNSGAKYITTYFRRTFTVAGLANFTALNLRILRDDGVIVYLNGSEAYRNNMPAGVVNYQTVASSAVGGADESTFYSAALNPGYLVPGTNVVAAELHQSSGGSTDISFDFELAGTLSVIAPYVVLQPLSQSALVGQNVTLSVGVEGTPPLAYQWRFDGAPISGATAATLTLPNVQLSQAGAYSVVITNAAGLAASAKAILSVSEPDSDGDGLPDWWELANGTNPNFPDAGADPDQDRLTNFQELIAGTHPTNALSVLRLEMAVLDGSTDLRLGFTAVSNRGYTLQCCTNLLNATWQRLVTVSAQPTTRWWQGTNRVDGTSRFYRLVTPSQP